MSKKEKWTKFSITVIYLPIDEDEYRVTVKDKFTVIAMNADDAVLEALNERPQWANERSYMLVDALEDIPF